MLKLRFLSVIILGFAVNTINAQQYFKWYDSIPVTISGKELNNAWAGGLNFVQFSNIDLNLDGVKDLFVFDRTGNKIRTYVCNGYVDSVSFKYYGYYETKFPPLTDWALLHDYNCDGKEDIFTYSSLGSGIDIYQNISNSSNGLQFKLVSQLQSSVSYPDAAPPFNKASNLYVSSIDIPAVIDVDNDGDTDIVTFNIDGIHIEYHKNMSKENGYDCDSLIYKRASACWGYVKEDGDNNNITLFDTCVGNVKNPELGENDNGNRGYSRHSGSCELCLDMNGDGDKELIIGDISYKNLTMLTNGGGTTKASFTAKDVSFPANSGGDNAVELAYFPCGYYVDVNNDNVRDLIVGTNAANVSENFNSIVYYQNLGTDNAPIFKYKQSNFLQDNMIDVGEGAHPVFFDYDNDGLKDLFVGTNGYYSTTGLKYQIALFKNVGTNAYPKFDLITRDFANLSSLGISDMVPAFGDLDADGDADMIIGGFNGRLHYFENTGLLGGTANFVLKAANLKNSNNRVISVLAYASPQLFDVDNNGTNDLIIGSKNGRLAYYKYSKTVAGIPQFDSISHFWGGVNVTESGFLSGFSSPFAFKQNDTLKIVVGCENGTIKLYTEISEHITSGTFKLIDNSFMSIAQGEKSAPCLADINNDGLLDLIIGNYQGGVCFYKGTHDATRIETVDNTIYFDFDVFPNPVNNILNIRISGEQSKDYLLDFYNIMGQRILSEKITEGTWALNAVDLKDGIYFCRMSEINEIPSRVSTLSKRIVVQH